jgi:hypothetical protein
MSIIELYILYVEIRSREFDPVDRKNKYVGKKRNKKA